VSTIANELEGVSTDIGRILNVEQGRKRAKKVENGSKTPEQESQMMYEPGLSISDAVGLLRESTGSSIVAGGTLDESHVGNFAFDDQADLTASTDRGFPNLTLRDDASASRYHDPVFDLPSRPSGFH
jgi:hypothetical protein